MHADRSALISQQVVNCDVTGRTLSNCALSIDQSSDSYESEGIIVRNGLVYMAQSYLYTVDGPGVQTCTVGNQNQFTGCTMYGTIGANNLFAGPPSIGYVTQMALTSDGSVLYVNAYDSQDIWSCSVLGTTLSGCTIQQSPGVDLTGMALTADESAIYVGDYGNGAIYLCPVNGLTVSTCNLVIDQTTYPDLGYPWGLTII